MQDYDRSLSLLDYMFYFIFLWKIFFKTVGETTAPINTAP